MKSDLYVIGGIREGERSIKCEVISPAGDVVKLRMTKKMWEKYAFSSADTVSGETYREMKHDSEICEATSRAASLLADSPHSCKALFTKLKQKGFSEEAAETAVSTLLKRGFIDEISQARDIALKMAKTKERGPMRITSELQTKGYPRDVANAAAGSVPDEVYAEALRSALAKKARAGIPEDKKERDKLVASLVRLGFSPSKIISAMRSLENV